MIPPLPRRMKKPELVIKSVSAPTRGWNARDSLAKMKPEDAIQLSNYIPSAAGVDLRGGTTRFATITGVSTAPETLMVYGHGTTNKLLAAAGLAIYDVTLGGTISSALDSGYANNRWSYDAMTSYIVFVNGADTPQKFDGTTITDTVITGSGLTATDLIAVKQFKSRLFFIEKNTLNAWYLPTNAVAGTAAKLDFSSYCSLGGTLVAIGRWTRDGGSGSDDLCVFLTSRGEVLIYQGTDPASATTWELVGVFRIGAPVGNRPLVNLGSDLVIITENGFLPLSKVLPIDRIGASKVAISDRINPAVTTNAKNYKEKFGWEAIFYPRSELLIFNIPVEEGLSAVQFVLNTVTNAWCDFSGINAVCFAVFGESLYFGAAGGFVVEADTLSFSDDTLATVQTVQDIQGIIRPAFNYFGTAGIKKAELARPIFSADASLSFDCEMDADFSERNVPSTSFVSVEGSEWDVAPWDTSPWSGSGIISKAWKSCGGIGYCFSFHIRTSTQGIGISLQSIDYALQRGGVI